MLEQEVATLPDLSGADLHRPPDVIFCTLQFPSYHGWVAPLDVKSLYLAKRRAHRRAYYHERLSILYEFHDLISNLAITEIPWRRRFWVIRRQVQ